MFQSGYSMHTMDIGRGTSTITVTNRTTKKKYTMAIIFSTGFSTRQLHKVISEQSFTYGSNGTDCLIYLPAYSTSFTMKTTTL